MKINPFAVMQEEFDHTGIVFNPDNDQVMMLNRSGVELWRAFEKGCSIEAAVELLVEKFESVTPEQARQDVEVFVRQLQKESLLELEP
jgi:hypothetical protein